MINSLQFSLEDYLLDDFGDESHKNASLLNIYFYDQVFFERKIANREIDARAAYFFANSHEELKLIKKMSYKARKEKCRELIRTFLKNNTLDGITWDSNNHTKKQSDNDYAYVKDNLGRVLFCPYDGTQLKYKDIENVTDSDGHTHKMPFYRCAYCGGYYTSIDDYADLQNVKHNNRNYINLRLDAESVENRPLVTLKVNAAKVRLNNNTYKKHECYSYRGIKPNSCRLETCKFRLRKAQLIIKDANDQEVKKDAKFCHTCGTFYIPESLRDTCKDIFIFKNEVHRDPPIDPPTSGDHNPGDPKPSPKPKPTIHISPKDFMVRRNIFKCLKRDHEIQRIDAIVNMLDRHGEMYQETIPAGYCQECDKYIIMENVFERLKQSGVIACRIIDEKTYESDESSGGNKWAEESLLRQYGYTVSQKDNLSTEYRRRILEMIVENEVYSRESVVSFLNTLISRFGSQNTSMYDLAISKWEADRDYISRYKLGSNVKVKVGSISTKHR